MKTKYTSILAGAMIALASLPALADSFNCTNCIGPTNAITGWPTNAVSTNGLGQGTGGAISLVNQEWAGFYFQGYVPTNVGTAGNIVVTLLRSWASNPPGVSYGTNIFTSSNVLNTSDWETWSNTVPFTLSIPINTTNYIAWHTNLDRWVLGGANWVGIGVITNSATNSFITNVVMGLNKKIIPIRYP